MAEMSMSDGMTKGPGRAARPTVHRRTRIGVVETDQRDKSIKVRIDRLTQHPKYGKYLRRRSVLHAHDETNSARVGDEVEIMECRPISRTKSWRLVRIVRRRAGG